LFFLPALKFQNEPYVFRNPQVREKPYILDYIADIPPEQDRIKFPNIDPVYRDAARNYIADIPPEQDRIKFPKSVS